MLVRSGVIAKKYGTSTHTINAWAERKWIPSILLPSGQRRYDPEAVDTALQVAGKATWDLFVESGDPRAKSQMRKAGKMALTALTERDERSKK